MKSVRRLLRDGRGTAGAEMALVTPLLVMLMFGSFELGNYFWNEHIVVKAVRDSARFAGRQPFAAYDCATGNIDADTAARIKNLTRTGQTTGGSPRLAGWTNDEITVSVACSATKTGIFRSQANGAPVVTVTAVVPYRSLFSNLVLGDSFHVKSQAQSAVMGL